MTKEIWTAIRDDEEIIYFEVEDEVTGKKREEKRYKVGLPLMFATGGHDATFGHIMAAYPLPWKMKKHGTDLYLDENIGTK